MTYPDFVVHDEPTSFLDTSSRAEILARPIRLKEEMDLSYLYISYDLTTVRDMADCVAVGYLSQIVEMGTRETFFEHHLHPYTRTLLSSTLFPDPTLERSSYKLEGEIPSPIDLPSGCCLYRRCPRAQPDCEDTPPRLVEVGGGHLVRCQVVTSERSEARSSSAPAVESAAA